MCYNADTMSIVDHHVCRVGTVATTLTAAHLQERVAELLRRSVVDDRVDTRVEVRQTVPQHAHSLHRIVNINVLLVA